MMFIKGDFIFNGILFPLNIIYVQYAFYCSLSEDFPNSEEAWNALAWRGISNEKAVKGNRSDLTGKLFL